MNFIQNLLTENKCYIAGAKMAPRGIVVHSTGVNQTKTSAYLTSWNKSEVTKCVHAFIGYLPDGTFGTVQTLPFNYKCWGCGNGSKGSYNNSHIQFEICEDNLTDSKYFNICYKEAVEFCAELCKTYGIDTKNIVCHAEVYRLGYGTGHTDVEHWFPKFGKTMENFRADVEMAIKGDTSPAEESPVEEGDEEVAVTYYDWTTACPDWSVPYVQKALDMGIIKGDEQGRLRLTDDRIWTLVVTLRATGIMK